MLKALAEEGYETPTPIQAQAIPVLLEGADLLGIAQTGTGKTAAFALPLLTRIASEKRPAPRRGARILVLSPTRELAAQIGESFRTYGRHLGTSVAVIFGGVAHKPQINAMSRGVDVLVATPGRLIDHMETGAVTLEGVEALVLDEADQMLDLGFVRPIRRIVSKLRARRQNLFFSATMPHEIAALAAELLHEPVKVQVTPVATTAERVSQRVVHIEANKKRTFLASLFADPEMSRTLVFTRTKRGADRVARHLEVSGIPAVAIHGNKSQRQREIALEAFRNAKIGVLVATDIAARGIDIDGITHVINYELPEVPEAYVHRIGRTARAGAEGHAISLCDGAERDLLRGIERLTRQQIPADDRRNDASIAVDVREKPTHGARSAGRPQRGERAEGAGGRSRHRNDERPNARRADGENRKPRSFEAGRSHEGNQEGRRDDSRRNDARSEDGRRDAGRRNDGRPNARRADGENRKPRSFEAGGSHEGHREGRRDDSRREGAHRRPDHRRGEYMSTDGNRAPWRSNDERSAEPRQDAGHRPKRSGKPHDYARGSHHGAARDSAYGSGHDSERRASRGDRVDRSTAASTGHKTPKPHRKGQSAPRNHQPEGAAVGNAFTEREGGAGNGAAHRHSRPGKPHHRDGKGHAHASGHGSGGRWNSDGHSGGNRNGGGHHKGSGGGRPHRQGGEQRRQRSSSQARRPETV